tara:strand:+ start:2285 stop:3346 length:1062 start_codon:yes stop_codon:yes gene_type:complete
MSVATSTQYWSSRLTGNDPTEPVGNFNEAWTGSAGSEVNDYWVIPASGGYYSITPTTTSYTILSSVIYTTAPSNDAILLELDNGTKKVQVKATGDATSLKLVGATTTTITDLDMTATEINAVPTILRLTLDASGNAKLYINEHIQDDNAEDIYYSVSGATGSSATVKWGNSSGEIKWGSVYYSKFGAFNPEELMSSDFAQDALSRMGLSIVQVLRDSDKMYLKTQVPDSSIIYGYDISSNMLSRLRPPLIHVMIERLNSPEFDALGGSRVTQIYEVLIFITTKGTNYENAYRSCLNITGEVFDELYTKTGLLGSTDSITNYTCLLDTKVDPDETVCTHRLGLTYMRKIDMRHR